ncbi:Amino acid permease [Luteimonas sp. 9C]|uniref:APC family permease n=1 Tax=Luteimonas sp. 9C TaxID=2653148 RepID=UPI0012F45AC2|nr:amino acid permease [Luteimonas sp. 9C]VXB44421.1 Amino acid permease [Luteimonas sp. 9C]
MARRERRPATADPVSPRATLRARDAFAITIGIVVGAGIFRTPSLIAGASGTEFVLLAAWIVGGLLSIVGALCYAELATTYPQAGGDYSYLRRAYGLRPAFLFAWARVSVIQTGSIALLCFIVGDYMAQLFDLGPWSSALYAAAAVIGLTGINWIGTRQGATVQTWLTIAEIAGVLVIVVAGLAFAPTDIAPVPGSGGDSAIGLILVFVLLTYGGWNEAVYVTSEVRDAKIWMPRVLVLSLIAVAALYVLVNLAYLKVLGLGGMAEHNAVAAEVMGRVFGPTGAVLMSVIVVAAALTSANATMITGARSVYAVGRDFPALGFIGRWDARSGAPRAAIVTQGVLALALVALGAFARGGFEVAVEYTAPVFWLFFLLVGIALFVLRRRDPDLPRPFRVPLYPVLPLLFCATSAYLLYSSLAYTGRGALVGVAVLAVGAVLLLLFEPNPLSEETPP